MCELYHPFSVCLAKASLNAQGLFLNQIDKRLKRSCLSLLDLIISPKMPTMVNVKHKWVKKLNWISSKQIHLFLSRWMLLFFFFFFPESKSSYRVEMRVRWRKDKLLVGSIIREQSFLLFRWGGLRLGTCPLGGDSSLALVLGFEEPICSALWWAWER